MKSEALRLAELGFSVVPINPRTKRTPVKDDFGGGYSWTPFQSRKPTAEEIESFIQRYPGCAIGVVCGAGSGQMEALDFDIPGKELFEPGQTGEPPAWKPWCRVLIDNGHEELLRSLTVAQTQSGGRHVYYRCPQAGRNSKLAEADWIHPETGAIERKALIETRGNGGLVVVPPSPGYKFVNGGFDTVPTLNQEQRDILVRAAKLLDETEPAEDENAKRQTAALNGAGRPGDDFNTKADWDELLSSHGWTRAGKFGGQTLWRRPGKKDGWSARTGGKAGDLFYCWSTNATGIPSEKSLSKFAFVAYADHGGNFATAAKALRARGFGGSASLSDSGQPPADPEEEEEEKLPSQTDTGNARILLDLHQERLLYIPEWKKWTVHKNGVWQPDDGGAVYQLALDVAQARKARADQLAEFAAQDPKYAKTAEAALKFANACQNRSKLESMAAMASTFAHVQARAAEMDCQDLEICCPNGVVDLRTGQLRDHRPTDRFTKQVPVEFDPDAKAPTFERFVREISRDREHLARALMLYLGYCLTGTTREQVWLLLYGPRGRNGKTTLHNLLQATLGLDLAGPIDKRLLRASNSDGARFSMSDIEGKRLVMANETASRSRLDTEFIKEFVGGGIVRAERKGLDAYPITLRAKLIYSVNHFPSADFDNSFRSRTVVFPCDQSFYAEGNPEWQPGDLPPDPQLDDKLAAEAPGIFAMLVSWCAKWFESGIEIPQESRQAVEEYEAENDHVGEWIGECCAKDDNARSKVGELHKAFQAWAKEKNAPAYRTNEFKHRLAQEPGVRFSKPKGVNYAIGLRMLDGQASLAEEDPYAEP